jgi:hypothetical protein
MKAGDLDFREKLRFDVETGITTFGENRVVIFDASAIGLLRQDLINEIGFERARKVFLKFGYQNGFADFMQMKLTNRFDDEMELLSSGPVVHTWEGIVRATPLELHFDREAGRFFFTGVWTNSFEAEQHLRYNTAAGEPVCWTLMGYASGWCTAFFERPLIAIEPVCMGMGHNRCEWKIQTPADWGDAAKPYLDALGQFFSPSTA